MTSKSEVPPKSDLPVDSSCKSAPMAKMSLRRSSGSPRHCSGDMYAILPRTVPVVVSLERLVALAMPKSVMSTPPS